MSFIVFGMFMACVELGLNIYKSTVKKCLVIFFGLNCCKFAVAVEIFFNFNKFALTLTKLLWKFALIYFDLHLYKYAVKI